MRAGIDQEINRRETRLEELYSRFPTHHPKTRQEIAKLEAEIRHLRGLHEQMTTQTAFPTSGGNETELPKISQGLAPYEPSIPSPIGSDAVEGKAGGVPTTDKPKDYSARNAAPKGEARAQLKMQTWQEFLAAAPEEREWTVENILPDTGLVVLGGRGKHGKSTFAIHMCRAIASGQIFLGKPTKPKSVIYINYEMPDDYLASLLSEGEVPKKAYVVNRPEPVLSFKTIEDLIGQEGMKGVLVIDSFRGAFKLLGDSENSAGGAGVILRRLQDLAIKTGWLILVIHHRNRKSEQEGADSLSGTGDWIAAPDVIFTWVRPHPDRNGTLTIEGRIPPVDRMMVKMTPQECVLVASIHKPQETTDREIILNTLGREWKTAEELASEIGLPEGTVRTRLKTLYREGLVGREGAGSRGDPYKWQKSNSARRTPLSAEFGAGSNATDRASGWEEI